MISNEYLFGNVGIDSMAFYAPRFYVDIEEFAAKRQVDPNKYTKGLLLKEMRIPDVGQDIISLGLKAAYIALTRGKISPKKIDAVFCGTETETYAVKSVSNIFAELLGVSANCMTQDIYNACAGGTLAILNALALIEQGILKRALVICADISSYQIGTPSEATQGSGAIAFILSRNPRVATFSRNFGKVSGNINDFYRPVGEKNAHVFGQYSVQTYLNFQLAAYDDLIRNIGDFHADFYTFHAPFAKLPIKTMQQIILKRWINHIANLIKLKPGGFRQSILKKLDYFLHDVSVLPEYLYLKLKERGYRSETLESMSHWLISNVKTRVLPQLRVPSHFGNMYNASIWAQIIYILENFAHPNDTIYWGSYGSGATCISGLLKVQERFKVITRRGPKINHFINRKERKNVLDYELIKTGNYAPPMVLGQITEHELNKGRGFTLHFCNEGCLIPSFKGLDYCPKGHEGFNERFFPLFAVLNSDPLIKRNYNEADVSYLKEGWVRISGNVKKGNCLEYEIRRIENKNEQNYNAVGLLNWIPVYIGPIDIIY